MPAVERMILNFLLWAEAIESTGSVFLGYFNLCREPYGFLGSALQSSSNYLSKNALSKVFADFY